MEKRIIQFSPPDIGEQEIEKVVEVLRSGWITTGPRTKELEKKIANYLNSNRAVCLNSQTACAEMALRVLGIGPGDEVLVPAYTYTASASVVCHVGARLVLVDCQRDSLEMDYDIMESLITDKTKAVIPVDLAGIPCDYDKIYSILEEKKSLFKPSNDIQAAFRRVIVCADCAHALGAKYKGKMVGSVADFSSFSFHAVKNFTTAEGGALTWKSIEGIADETIYQQVQLLSLHGQSKDALAKTELGSWEYDVVGPWFKCNMPDVLAAIGLAQLKRYPSLLARRREIIKRYDTVFKENGIKYLDHFNEVSESSGHLYISRIPGISEDRRNAIITSMAERGISTNVHYKPLPLMTAYKNLGFDIVNFPYAFQHYENEITLPLYSLLSNTDVDYVAANYIAVVQEYL